MKHKLKNNDLNELIHLAQSGDDVALEEIIRRQQKVVFASLYYLDSDNSDILDITQEVLLKVAKNIKRLKNPKTFKSWLNQIITNQFYDSLRKKQKSASIKKVSLDEKKEESKELEVPDHSANPYKEMARKELGANIKKSISKLENPFKSAIIMRELQGLSYEEIANATNSNIGTVKSRIARARLKLQEDLRDYIR